MLNTRKIILSLLALLMLIGSAILALSMTGYGMYSSYAHQLYSVTARISIFLLVKIHGELHSTATGMSGWLSPVAILLRLVTQIRQRERLRNIIRRIRVG